MNNFANIPAELQACGQWVLWRLEKSDNAKGVTKPLYIAEPNGGKASTTNPATWRSFQQCISAPMDCIEPVDPTTPVSKSGYSGIGFVFSKDDPFTGIDLDDTEDDKERYQEQLSIFHKFDSYTEISPSGKGVHIIVKGKVPTGRRRLAVEVYSEGRYFTMTGNTIKNKPIEERQALLDILWEELAAGKDSSEFMASEIFVEASTDEQILEMAKNARNGDKFCQLWAGNWQRDYPSQSEADFALYDMLAYYSKHFEQTNRLFLQSALGERDKAKRVKYLRYMFEKSFDNQLPKVNFDFAEQVRAQLIKEDAAANLARATEPGRSSERAQGFATASPVTTAGVGTVPIDGWPVNLFPPGLLGETAQFFYQAAPRPVPEIAMAAAIAYFAGITGRAYNVSRTGLNQYILMLAQTGTGKEAAHHGMTALTRAVKNSVPSIVDFGGPGELVSAPGVIKWLEKKPCILSVVGEFGKKMREMSSPNASIHLTGLSRFLLQIYSKSGIDSTFDPMAYSDKDKNTASINAPSLTIFGESTPESFYDGLDESMITDGLLPRFMIFEYIGERSHLNKASGYVIPSVDLVNKVSDLAATSLAISSQNKAVEIPLLPDAEAKFDEFDRYTTNVINAAAGDSQRQLWNRAHLKALKLAGVRAVTDNWHNPLITLEHCMWATDIIVAQTNKLVAKFELGEIGQSGPSENRQLNEVVKVFHAYTTQPWERFSSYKSGTEEMHRKGVITESLIQRKLMCISCFKNDRLGPNQAIKRAIKLLLDADEIGEVPRQQMIEQFGAGPRSFIIRNPARFTQYGS